MRQSPTESGGAYSLRHGKLLDIRLSRGEYVMLGTERMGKEINWEITKGKAGTHEGRKGSFRYIYEPPHVEAISDLISTCTSLGVIKRGGGVYEFEENGEPQKLKGQAALEEYIENNVEAIRCLREAALRASGLDHIRYR
jgi:hypothetical protein